VPHKAALASDFYWIIDQQDQSQPVQITTGMDRTFFIGQQINSSSPVHRLGIDDLMNYAEVLPDFACPSAFGVSVEPRFVPREEWLAELNGTNGDPFENTPQYVIVISTEEPKYSCYNPLVCSSYVRDYQRYHRSKLLYDDLGYNFIIGNDGLVYVGRGWKLIGAHTIGWNRNSLGIAFIGGFEDELPSASAIAAYEWLMDQAVDGGYLSSDYVMYAMRDVDHISQSPGDRLYASLPTLPHYKDANHQGMCRHKLPMSPWVKAVMVLSIAVTCRSVFTVTMWFTHKYFTHPHRRFFLQFQK
jgi:N-acetylmuramoyl-L-alanine amidase